VLSLSERFEAAYQEYGRTYFWKVRLYHAGLRLYSNLEFYEDLRGCALEYDLFPEALWAYHRMRHPGPMLVGKPLEAISPLKLSEAERRVEEINDEARLRRIGKSVLGIAIILTVFSLMLLAPALYGAALSHWHEAILPLLIGLVACVFAFNFWASYARLRIRQREPRRGD
jgi:hypothetical protein